MWNEVWLNFESTNQVGLLSRTFCLIGPACCINWWDGGRHLCRFLKMWKPTSVCVWACVCRRNGIRADRRAEIKTQMSIDSILFRACLIRNQVFITDRGVGSLYFTLKSQEVWKVTSQRQIFALINIPWAITCERGIGAQRGTPAEETAGEREKKKKRRKRNPSSSTDQSVGAENLRRILSEGRAKGQSELGPCGEKGWQRRGESDSTARTHTHTYKMKWRRRFPKPCSCACLFIITSQNKSVGNKLLSGH